MQFGMSFLYLKGAKTISKKLHLHYEGWDELNVKLQMQDPDTIGHTNPQF